MAQSIYDLCTRTGDYKDTVALDNAYVKECVEKNGVFFILPHLSMQVFESWRYPPEAGVMAHNTFWIGEYNESEMASHGEHPRGSVALLHHLGIHEQGPGLHGLLLNGTRIYYSTLLILCTRTRGGMGECTGGPQ